MIISSPRLASPSLSLSSHRHQAHPQLSSSLHQLLLFRRLINPCRQSCCTRLLTSLSFYHLYSLPIFRSSSLSPHVSFTPLESLLLILRLFSIIFVHDQASKLPNINSLVTEIVDPISYQLPHCCIVIQYRLYYSYVYFSLYNTKSYSSSKVLPASFSLLGLFITFFFLT